MKISVQLSLFLPLALACSERPKTIGTLPPGMNDPNDPGESGPCYLGLTGEPGAASGGVVKLAAGDRHTCALFASGAVECWGDNRLGSVGDGTRDNKRATPVGVRGLDDAIDIAIGTERSCALRAGGVAACWGMIGPYGFDLLDPVSSDVPKCMHGMSDGVAITGGHYHYCAVLASQQVVCWGENNNGELAELSEDWRRTPVLIPGITGAEKVATGSDHSCALTGGRILCWGSNASGQLGAGLSQRGSTPEPQTVLGIEDAVDVVAGESYGCALRSGGRVSCWGSNYVGQLGAEVEDLSDAPVDVDGLPEIVELAAGDIHACARTADHRLFCWGSASDGRIGPDITSQTTTPVEVDAGSVEHVVAGGAHTCVLSAGAVLCFGNNDAGQLGDGSLFSRAEPGPVTF